MKKEFLDIFKENPTVKISFFFILMFPIILLVGSSIVNTSVILMNIIFLIHIFNEKKFQIFDNRIFYSLCALWAFLIINTLINDDFKENYTRAFGFVRFILLIFLFSYFLSYKKFQFKRIVFNFWTLIFIIVSLDLLFEYVFGFNTLGFKNIYDGRLSGFMGDELVIGHWYLCFSLIILSNVFNQTKIFYFLVFLSIIISFLIGERANFIRLFLAITFLLLITRHVSLKSLIVLTFTFGVIIFFANNSEKNGKDEFKNRYYYEFKSLAKHNSIKGLNNNNSYTPMFFNAYFLFKENKMLGVGLGSYYQKSHEIFRKYKTTNEYRMIPNTHPHQYHLEILATLGLPGYMFIFLFLLYFFYKSFVFYQTDKNIINLSSFLMIFVFCLPILPTGSFFTTYGATIFWLNFSLMNLGNFKNINY